METNIKDKLCSIAEKIKADKKSIIIIFIGLAGMLFVSFSEFADNVTGDSAVNSEYVSYNESCQRVELEQIIGEISGVGRVRVMITYEGTRESVFASDTSEDIQEKNGNISTEYIIVDGGSEEKGLLLKEIYPKVMGVAVVCEGGDNPTVKNEITMLIKAVFNISSNKISISEMQK